jgi:hypothetical protein
MLTESLLLLLRWGCCSCCCCCTTSLAAVAGVRHVTRLIGALVERAAAAGMPLPPRVLRCAGRRVVAWLQDSMVLMVLTCAGWWWKQVLAIGGCTTKQDRQHTLTHVHTCGSRSRESLPVLCWPPLPLPTFLPHTQHTNNNFSTRVRARGSCSERLLVGGVA